MVKIVIENLDRQEVEVNDTSKTVLAHFQDHFIDWMHACGAKGRCTTCKMIVLEGLENLNEMTLPELRYQSQGALLAGERLTCQAITKGDLLVKVPNSGKLPHLSYTD